MISKIKRCAAGFVLAAGLAGCATFGSQTVDHNKMLDLAAREGFKQQYLSAPPFILTAYHRSMAPSDVLVVYIEGDGRAWASRTMPSDDPTPKYPLAFFLACEDKASNILYLARPGQFRVIESASVDQVYWTSKRYSEEVIQSMNAAINEIKRSSGARQISLIGYSGGAAVAVLVAALRDDVIALRTVAGNLAINIFTQEHHLSPLLGSLDPLDEAQAVKGVPQRHFIGRQDKIVTKKIIGTFLDAEGDVSRKRLTELEDADHSSRWVKRWNELLALPLY
jgi:hypothetical protein